MADIDHYLELLAEAGPELEDELVREVCEGSLYSFLKEAWPAFDPAPFVGGWHLEAICEHLEAVSRGQIKRLLINIPPRHSKPIHENELILERTRGRIALKDVKVGDEVLTHKGRFRHVLAVHEQGELDTASVRTWSGRTVRAAMDHPFLTPSGWVPLRDLHPGMTLGVVTPQASCGKSTITAEEARLLGYLIGDGCLTQGQPRLTSASDEVSRDFEACAASVGLFTERKANNGGWNSWNVVLRGAAHGRFAIGGQGNFGPVRLWLMKHGIWGKNSYDKRVPDAVMAGTEDVVANFIGAYWSCDGYLAKRGYGRSDVQLGADSVSRALLSDVQHLLVRLGIFSRIRTKTAKILSKRQQSDTYTSFSLSISDMDNAAKFIDAIPIAHLKGSIGSNYIRKDFDRVLFPDDVVAVTPSGVGRCRCLTVEEDHSFVVGDIAVSNTSAVSIAWPVWTWAQRPTPGNVLIGPGVRFLCASYGAKKAQQDGVTARRLIASQWFQRHWGDRVAISDERDNQEEYDTTAGGHRISTGIPESLGKGGMIRLWDDPHKTDQVESDDVLASQIRAYNEVWRTRSNDPNVGAEVGVMQRLGQGDLSGYLLDHDSDVVHLCLPALFEPDMRCVTVIGFEDPREDEDEPLWPERYSYQWYKTQQDRIGNFAFAGQYQQRPIPRGGGIIMREWWQAWPPDEAIERWTNAQGQVSYPPWEFVLAYLDTAFTKKEENDWSALTRWGVFGDSAGRPRAMMCGAWRERMNFRELITRTATTCRAGKVDVLVIENKAGGSWVAEELMKEMRNGEWQIVLDTPTVDKISRAHAVVPLFADKMIFAPFMHEAGVWRSWVEMVIEEVENFPRARHDDLTDTVTGALGYLRRNDLIKLSVEHDEDERDARTLRGGRSGVAGLYGVG